MQRSTLPRVKRDVLLIFCLLFWPVLIYPQVRKVLV